MHNISVELNICGRNVAFVVEACSWRLWSSINPCPHSRRSYFFKDVGLCACRSFQTLSVDNVDYILNFK